MKNYFPLGRLGLRTCLAILLAFNLLPGVSAKDLWHEAAANFKAGDFEKAASIYQVLSTNAPSPGVLQNLGLAQWQATNTGPAILAWERALWLSPQMAAARGNLRFARRSALLGEPDLAWYEICSTWCSADAWAVLAMLSFWITLALMILPGVFKFKKTAWTQMLAAGAFALFLLTLPAMWGIQSRTHLAIVVGKEAPLQLTPTAQGQVITRIAWGETARVIRSRGDYCYVRTSGVAGWMQKARLGFIAAD